MPEVLRRCPDLKLFRAQEPVGAVSYRELEEGKGQGAAVPRQTRLRRCGVPAEPAGGAEGRTGAGRGQGGEVIYEELPAVQPPACIRTLIAPPGARRDRRASASAHQAAGPHPDHRPPGAMRYLLTGRWPDDGQSLYADDGSAGAPRGDVP